MRSRWWWFSGFAVVLSVLSAAGYWYWAVTQPLHPGNQTYVIPPGTGALQFARRLTDRGVTKEPYSLLLSAYAKRYTHRIKAGEYQFRDGLNMLELLEQVVRGEVVQYTVTFIEGWTFKQIRDVLARAPRLKQMLKDKNSKQIMSLLDDPQLHPEGRFFPDTYLYSAGSSDLDVLRQGRLRMKERLQSEWEQRAQNLVLTSADEALVLASIIEKETGDPSERALISGVFHNRLRRGMRLQTDPAVIYGLGDQFDGNLTRSHLRTDTPYNTYTRVGLPPTPIAMPGGEAIHAALHPEDTAAVYFVSRGDGTHQFSDTLHEHNRAVAKYQLRRGGGEKRAKVRAAQPSGGQP